MMKRLLRPLLYVFLLLLGLFGACVAVLQLWVLPHINDYRKDIAAAVTRATGMPVVIGQIQTDWNGVYPRLSVGGVDLLDGKGHITLHLPQVTASISWLSLLSGQVHLHALTLDAPDLTVARDADGHIRVAGVRVDQPSTEGGGFADWLIRQSHIRIDHATVHWHDALGRLPDTDFKQVRLDLANWLLLHQVSLSVTPANTLARQIHLSGTLTGRHLADWRVWKGQIHAVLEQVDLAALGQWVPMPNGLTQGRVDFSGDLGFKNAALDDLRGQVDMQAVRIQPQTGADALLINRASGQLDWRHSQDGVALTLHHLAVDAGPGLRFAPIDVSMQLPAAGSARKEGQLTATELPLDVLNALSSRLPALAREVPGLDRLMLTGTLRDLSLRWTGTGDNLQITHLHTRLINAGFGDRKAGMQLTGLTGLLATDGETGEVQLVSRNAVLSWPRLFEAPITADILDGRIKFRYHQGDLSLETGTMRISNRDAAGTFNLWVDHFADNRPDQMDLHGQLTRGIATRVVAYLPLNLKAARDWTRAGILAGKLHDVAFEVKGAAAQFPFVNDQGGVFDITGQVDNGRLRFDSNWPQIDQIRAALKFHGATLQVVASTGTMLGAAITHATVNIPDLSADNMHVLIAGAMQGPTQSAINYVNNSPIGSQLFGLTKGLTAQGNGRLALKLDVPVSDSDTTTYAGSWTFNNNHLSAAGRWPDIDHLNGVLAFDNHGLRLNNLSGISLGGPVVLRSETVAGEDQIQIHGQATARALKDWFGHPELAALTGRGDYAAQIRWHRGLADLHIVSNLRGMALAVPAPVGKPAGTALPLDVQLHALDATHDEVQMELGNGVGLWLSRRQQGQDMKLVSGVLSLGGRIDKAVPPGFWVQGKVAAIDLDYWRQLIAQAHAFDSGVGTGMPAISGVRLEADTLDVFGRRLHHARLNVTPGAGQWQVQVDSDEMAGHIHWQDQGAGVIQARFRYFSLPGRAPAQLFRSTLATDASSLPAMDITADSFRLSGRDLGQLHLAGRKMQSVWRIDDCTLINPDMNLKLQGQATDDPQHPQTRMQVNLTSPSAGKLLTRLGYPGNIKEGATKLTGVLSWPGDMTEFKLSALSGKLNLEVGRGQFTKLESGAGKLLGILSLQALPRRIALDFHDVFSQGFSFDGITAVLNIHQGIVHSDDFRMAGPSARIQMAGEADLTHETQDMHVRILPSVSDGVALAEAFLHGPVIGLTALVVQKLLKDPFDQIVAFQYHITGTWAEPTVTRVKDVKGKSIFKQ